uniref:Uncharacterized protein n=1 Tax=Vespula pensylvanica TaxID=30213 RepID=A0A834PGR0_VESPE|nr:hypothetical protein H0235_001287 [Vespula pensylvanica]
MPTFGRDWKSFTIPKSIVLRRSLKRFFHSLHSRWIRRNLEIAESYMGIISSSVSRFKGIIQEMDLRGNFVKARRNLFAERQVAYAAHPAHLRSSFWNSFAGFASRTEALVVAAAAAAVAVVAVGDMQQRQLAFDFHISAFVPSLYAKPMTV